MLGFVLTLSLVSITADSAIANFKAKWRTVQDYVCEVESYQRKGKKEQYRVYDYKFMRPLWIKMVIIDGDDKGGKASYNFEDGKVHARKPGLVGKIKIKLSPDNKLVKSIRGQKITESHFGHLLVMLKDARRPIKLLGDTVIDGVELVGLTGYTKEGLKFNIYLRKTNFLPYRIEEYEDGVLVHRATYRKLRINVGLKKEDFKI